MKLKIISDIFPDVLAYVSSALDALKDTNENIQIDITSYGGDVFVCAAICEKIKEYQEQGYKFNASIYGIAASAAADIALTCDYVEMAETSALMIHSAFRGDGKKDKGLEIANKFQLQAIQKRMPDFKESELKTEKWYTAFEALESGLVDGVFNVLTDTGKESARLSAMYMARKNTINSESKMEVSMDEEKKELIEKDEKEVEEKVEAEESPVSVEDLLERMSERLKYLEDRLDAIENNTKAACGDDNKSNARLKALYDKVGAVCAPAQRQDVVVNSTPEDDLEKSKAMYKNSYELAKREI